MPLLRTNTKFMKLKTILGLVFFVLPICTSLLGQKGARVQGYIIDNKDQKIEGFIEILGELNAEVKVKFSEKKSAKKYATIKIKDLNGYGFVEENESDFVEKGVNWRHFIKYEFERPAKVFASNKSLIELVVSEGHYTVYKFLYETGGNVEMPITTRYVVMNKGEEVAQVEEDNFNKEAKRLFAGYTALIDSLGEKKFQFKNFVRLTDDYNYWIIEQHDPNKYKLNPKIYNTHSAQ